MVVKRKDITCTSSFACLDGISFFIFCPSTWTMAMKGKWDSAHFSTKHDVVIGIKKLRKSNTYKRRYENLVF